MMQTLVIKYQRGTKAVKVLFPLREKLGAVSI